MLDSLPPTRATFPSLILLAVCGSAAAWADEVNEGFDAHDFYLVGFDGHLRDPLAVSRPERFTRLSWYGAALLEYAEQPLTHVTGNPDDPVQTAALDNLLALNLDLGFAPHPLLRLQAGMPVFLSSLAEDGSSNGPGPGDLRLSAASAILAPGAATGQGLGLGLLPYLSLPTGDQLAFLGQRSVAGGLAATGSYGLQAWTFSGQLGLDLHPDIELQNVVGSDTVSLGLAAGRLLGNRSAANLELLTALPLQASERRGSEASLQALASYRHRLQSGLHLAAGMGAGLSRAVGTAPFRVFVGGGLGRDTAPPPPDLDLDGVADERDPCPEQAETINGWRDDDGCPDYLGTIIVRPIFREQQVEHAQVLVAGPLGETRFGPGMDMVIEGATPGAQFAAQATAGSCLAGVGSAQAIEGPVDLVIELDRALDGSLDLSVVDQHSAPVPRATVRFLDDDDPCGPYEPWVDLSDQGRASLHLGAGEHPVVITAPYFAAQRQSLVVSPGQRAQLQVTLEPARTRIEGGRIVILEKVFFETARAVIMADSHALLSEVANLLLASPRITLLEVAGHTDAQGPDDYNLELSQARADAVVSYLRSQGVAASRLQASGYGETAPIADEASEQGRAQNRRVEFNIKGSAPEPGDQSAGAAPEGG